MNDYISISRDKGYHYTNFRIRKEKMKNFKSFKNDGLVCVFNRRLKFIASLKSRHCNCLQVAKKCCCLSILRTLRVNKITKGRTNENNLLQYWIYFCDYGSKCSYVEERVSEQCF